MERELALMIPIISIVLGIGVAFWAIYWDHQKKATAVRRTTVDD